MAICSPEMQAFRKVYSNLVFGIQHLEQLAAQLYSHAVIDRDVLQVVQATETPTFHKTAQLLASVEDYIKTNPSALGLFLSTLGEEPSLVHFADALFDECRECVNCSVLKVQESISTVNACPGKK